MEKLAERISASQGQIWQLMEAPEMSDPHVASRVSVAMSATQPLLPSSLRGSFEGLMGQLGLNLTDASEPPQTRREGYITRFTNAITDVFRKKGVDFEPNWIKQVAQHWDHKYEFEKRLAQPVSVHVWADLYCQGSSPSLRVFTAMKMESLEVDLNLGRLAGANIWDSFKEDEVLHPWNLLNQMW